MKVPRELRRAAFQAGGATTVVLAVTGANRAGELSVSSVASSPQALGEGRVWLLLSSALIADRPWAASVVGFAVVAVAALALFSARTAAGIAIAGHTVSALSVYAAIACVRLADPAAFASVLQLSDYGLSAVIGAWLGAIARLLWSRTPSLRGRLAVVAGSLGCAGIGLALRPDVTALDAEHVVAFAIGAVLAEPRARAWFARPARRLFATAAGLASTFTLR